MANSVAIFRIDVDILNVKALRRTRKIAEVLGLDITMEHESGVINRTYKIVLIGTERQIQGFKNTLIPPE